MSSKTTVVGSRENDPGNHRNCGRECCVTATHDAGPDAGPRTNRRWRLGSPDQLARSQTDSRQSARVQRDHVRIGEVGHIAIDCEPPFDPPELAARTHAILPDDSALAVRVEAVGHARLLTDHEKVVPIRHGDERRRGAEVVVGALVVRTVGVVSPAAHDEGVRRCQLVEPTDLAGVDVERDDRIARLGSRLGVGVAGGRVDETALSVDRRRPPDRGAGGPRTCRAIRARVPRRRFL